MARKFSFRQYNLLRGALSSDEGAGVNDAMRVRMTTRRTNVRAITEDLSFEEAASKTLSETRYGGVLYGLLCFGFASMGLVFLMLWPNLVAAVFALALVFVAPSIVAALLTRYVKPAMELELFEGEGSVAPVDRSLDYVPAAEKA